MSYIKSITVEGLAGRETPFSRELHRDVNIFFGLNGTGKTTLLRLMAAALSGSVAGLETAAFAKASVTVHSDTYDTDFVYSLDKAKLGDGDSERKTRRVRTATDGGTFIEEFLVPANPPKKKTKWVINPRLPEGFDGRWQHEFLSVHRLYHGAEGDESLVRVRIDDARLDRGYESVIQSYWARLQARLQVQIRNVQQRGIADILTALVAAPTAGVAGPQENPAAVYERLIRFLSRQTGTPDRTSEMFTAEQFRRAFHDNKNIPIVAQRIEQIEQEINRVSSPQTRLQTFIANLIKGNKTVSVSDAGFAVTTSDDKSIGVRSLSSGEKQLLRLLTAAIMAQQSSLIIDEPEMSMHVLWQQSLLTMLREINSDIQLVVATHSPEIMADWPDAKILRID